MKYTLTWQDFMRQPENKALKESKGIHACKQKFIQEQNKMMWMDPMIINETNSPGVAVANNNSANQGSSTQFITGQAAKVSTFTWAGELSSAVTASANFGITIHALQNGTSFNRNHDDLRKTILLAFVTGSDLASLDLVGLSTTAPDGNPYDVVVTASCHPAFTGPIADTTGSWTQVMANAINGQGAGAILAGFTNTIAPSTLISAATASNGGTLVITNVANGGVPLATTDVASTTGSIASTTLGTDTFHNEQGAQTFEGHLLPYAAMPRKQ
jgi:hypothetical protein